jgi:hypothetical protein
MPETIVRSSLKYYFYLNFFYEKTLLYTLGAWIFCMVFLACKKSVTTANSAITIENISGTYALKGLVWSFGGFNFNVFDSLDACEKDNLIKFNTDKTVNYIDAGTCMHTTSG